MMNLNILKKYKHNTNVKTILSGTLWLTLGSFISKGIVFIIWILVARFLGVDGNGQFGLIRNTTVIFASFAGLGLGITTTKFTAEFLGRNNEKVENIISMSLVLAYIAGLLIALLMFFFAPIYSRILTEDVNLTTELRIASAILLFSSITGAQKGTLEGLQQFKSIAKINIIQSIIAFPIFIIFTKIWLVTGSILSLTIFHFIVYILAKFELDKVLKNKGLKINVHNAFIEYKILLKYSLPAFLSGLVVPLLKWVTDSILVASQGFKQMGIFTAAFTFYSILMTLAVMTNGPFLSVLVKNKDGNPNSRLKKANILGTWFIGIVVVLPLLVFPEIGFLTYGKEYNNSDFLWAFILILLFTLINMYKQGLGRVIATYNLQWWAFFSNALWGIILLLCFLQLKKYGAIGLAISYLIAYFCNTIILIPLYIRKNIVPRKVIFSFETIAIWSIIFGCTFIHYFDINLIIRSILLIICYPVIIFLFSKIIKTNENN